MKANREGKKTMAAKSAEAGASEIPPGLGKDDLLRLYGRMSLIRRFETVAHDLNNLLPVINYSEMILEQTPPNSDLHDYAGHILLAGKRGKMLTGQMLSAARGRDEPMKLEELDIAKVVVEFSGLSSMLCWEGTSP